jgi:hypothetical protein
MAGGMVFFASLGRRNFFVTRAAPDNKIKISKTITTLISGKDLLGIVGGTGDTGTSGGGETSFLSIKDILAVSFVFLQELNYQPVDCQPTAEFSS